MVINHKLYSFVDDIRPAASSFTLTGVNLYYHPSITAKKEVHCVQEVLTAAPIALATSTAAVAVTFPHRVLVFLNFA